MEGGGVYLRGGLGDDASPLISGGHGEGLVGPCAPGILVCAWPQKKENVHSPPPF